MSSATVPTVDTTMLLATSLQFLICSCGFIMNTFLVFVLIRNRQLRSGPCGLLIMWMALFDGLAEFSLISLPMVLTFSGLTIPLLVCYYAEAYGPFVQIMGMWVMLFTSFDRLHAVLFPIHYKNSLKSRHKYVNMAVAISATLTISYQGYFFYGTAKTTPEKLVFCMPTDFMSGLGMTIGLYLALSLKIGTFLVYLLIWTLISCKIVPSLSNSATERRVFRSLFLLMAIVFCCWLPSSWIGQLVLPLFQLSPNTQNVLLRLVLQLSKIGQAVNVPILYACSSDYRCAMRKEMANLAFCCRKNQIGPAEQRMMGQGMGTSGGTSNNVQQQLPARGRPMGNNYM